MRYAAALALTLLVELPVYTLVLERACAVQRQQGAVAAVGVNVLTHPALWFVVLPATEGWFGAAGGLAAAETFAWLTEAAALWAWLRRDAPILVALALVANAASLLAGAVVGV